MLSWLMLLNFKVDHGRLREDVHMHVYIYIEKVRTQKLSKVGVDMLDMVP